MRPQLRRGPANDDGQCDLIIAGVRCEKPGTVILPNGKCACRKHYDSAVKAGRWWVKFPTRLKARVYRDPAFYWDKPLLSPKRHLFNGGQKSSSLCNRWKIYAIRDHRFDYEAIDPDTDCEKCSLVAHEMRALRKGAS